MLVIWVACPTLSKGPSWSDLTLISKEYGESLESGQRSGKNG